MVVACFVLFVTWLVTRAFSFVYVIYFVLFVPFNLNSCDSDSKSGYFNTYVSMMTLAFAVVRCCCSLKLSCVLMRLQIIASMKLSNKSQLFNLSLWLCLKLCKHDEKKINKLLISIAPHKVRALYNQSEWKENERKKNLQLSVLNRMSLYIFYLMSSVCKHWRCCVCVFLFHSLCYRLV